VPAEEKPSPDWPVSCPSVASKVREKLREPVSVAVVQRSAGLAPFLLTQYD